MKKLTFTNLSEYLIGLGIDIKAVLFDIYKQLLAHSTDKNFTYSVESFEFEKGIYTVIVSRLSKKDTTNHEVLEIVQSENDDYFYEKQKWINDFCKS